MGTYSADPSLLHTLSASTSSCADDVDGWGAAACGVMSRHGYWSSSSSAGGAVAACSAWARSWAASLAERATLLERDQHVPLGIQRAEGLVGLYDDGATFALEGVGPMSFAEWQQQRLEAVRFEPEVLDDVARLEAQLEALYEAARNAAGYGVVHAIELTARRLEQARIDRLMEARDLLVALETIPVSSRGFLQDTIDDLRHELSELSQALGLEPERFADAAAAMLEGISPGRAGVDPIYFPPWYVERHALHAELAGEAGAVEEEMWLAFDELMALGWSDDWEAQQATHDRFSALQDRLNELHDRIDEMEEGLPVGLAAVTGYLDHLPLVSDSVSSGLVGEFLAAEINEHSWDNVELEAIGRVVGRYVDEPAESVALFNALGEDAMLDIAALGTEWSNPNPALEAFATALAMASGEPALEITGADLVRAPISVNWFMYGDYDPQFLVEAAGAAIQADDIFLHFSGMGLIELPDGAEMANGIREVLLHLVAVDGPDTALALIEHASAAGLLGALVAPDNGYLDDGGAAGAVIALIGTVGGDASAQAMISVMSVLASKGGEEGVLNGAALMIAPHLASLVDEGSGPALDQTALRDALDSTAGDGALVREFLETILVDETAAANVYLALSYVMAHSLGSDLDGFLADGNEAGDVGASVFADSGAAIQALIALIGDADLDANLAVAGDTDAANARLQASLSFAADLAIAGVIALAAPEMLAVAVLAEVSGAAATNLLLPLPLEAALPTDNVEGVLEAGYYDAAQRHLAVNLLIAQLLDEAGVISVPPEWSNHDPGEPPLGDWDTFADAWAEFEAKLSTRGFDWDLFGLLADGIASGGGQIYPGDSIDGGD